MRQYKVIQGGGLWGVEDGDTIEIDLDQEGEAEYVDARGFLEVVPRTYKVIGPQEVYGAKHGETFEAAISGAQEAALIQGKHVELVKDGQKQSRGGKKRG